MSSLLTNTSSKPKAKPSSSKWLQPLPHDGETTYLPTGEKVRISTSWSDLGLECHEEYIIKTDQLIVRKWREKTGLGSWSPWIFEIGDPSSSASKQSGEMLRAAKGRNPEWSTSDERGYFVFRVRNIPYPIDVYSISIDDKDPTQIILRTSNRKYFKRFCIPLLMRFSLLPDSTMVKMEHNGTTLLVRYKKPDDIRRFEMQSKLRRKKKLKDPALQSEQCKTQ